MKTGMEAVFERCCGLDVHKKVVVACFHKGRKKETKSFGTSSIELRQMARWLLENECQIVCMESTGSYWKPIYNVLEVLGVNTISVVSSITGKSSRKLMMQLWNIYRKFRELPREALKQY